MQLNRTESGKEELQKLKQDKRSLMWIVGLFSFFTNLLMLTGPIYMLQIYDRVLASQSIETLLALSLLGLFLYVSYGILEYVRGRIMARVGAYFQVKLDRRVFDASMNVATNTKHRQITATAQRDLEAVQKGLASPGFMALFDIPWTPAFIGLIALFHPELGILAVCGAVFLTFVTLLNQLIARHALQKSASATTQSDILSDSYRSEAEMIASLGIRDNLYSRWEKVRSEANQETLRANDIAGIFSTISKTTRLILQSAMLGFGAYLTVKGELSPGAMIAGSILLGRALAPIDQILGQWPVLSRGRKGWQNLLSLLTLVKAPEDVLPLPKPAGDLTVNNITVLPPAAERATLKNISMQIKAGQAVGVIGPSGSGKTSLARAICAAWPVAGGKISLGGASIYQYTPDALGKFIGYLPQRVQLFHGTIADNIAKMAVEYDPERVVAAAQAAAVHDMIIALPEGYDTKVGPNGDGLSGGQRQRIGLARALFDDPILLILDEPNSNLDHDGSEALNQVIRQTKESGKSVLIMAHRPSAIRECDMLMILDQGESRGFGPREDVLKAQVKNHSKILTSSVGF